MRVKLLHSVLLKTPLTFPTLVTCEPVEFIDLLSGFILSEQTTVEELQMGDLRPLLMTLLWVLPDVSYSIVSHYVDTHEPYFSLKDNLSLKGIASLSAVRPGTYLSPVLWDSFFLVSPGLEGK